MTLWEDTAVDDWVERGERVVVNIRRPVRTLGAFCQSQMQRYADSLRCGYLMLFSVFPRILLCQALRSPL